jgi:alanyl-tRNA synthetase
LEDNYLTDLFLPIIQKIEELSNKSYTNNLKSMRIIADHIKASVFIINDGVIPSNTERGYVLRRLIRRAVRFGSELGLKNFVKDVALPVFSIYSDFDFLQKNKLSILNELEKEENKFLQTLEKGIKEFEKIVLKWKEINGEDAFLLYQSYGFPIEMTLELAKEKNIVVDINAFNEEYKKHQELSKTLSAGKFKSGLADNSELTTRYHSATHLLNEALRKIINKDIKQKGSNITSERLRFDFNLDRALTKDELLKIENEVNSVIQNGLEVKKEQMDLQDALKSGAQSEFGLKYPEKVSVYSIGDYSKEISMGPHVNNTKELGKFKIIKEESSASGIRRIKAVLEN